MSKTLRNLAIIALFLATGSNFGMEPEAESPLVKIQTSDEQEFDIARQVTQTSETLKNMIADIKDEAAVIPLPNTSGQQFNVLLPAMQQLAQLYIEKPQVSEKKVAQQLQQIVTDLRSNDKTLTNQQLIEFIAGANFLNIPLVEPALKALAERILNKDELQQLVGLQDKLKDLWSVHPAMQMVMLALQHPWVLGVIESRDGKNLISWSAKAGTIKIWDINNLQAEPTILKHSTVAGVIESRDGNLISWPWENGIIKIWDMALLDPALQQILQLLAVHFVSKGQEFALTAQELAEFKATFNTLSPRIQNILEKHAPDFVAKIKAAKQ